MSKKASKSQSDSASTTSSQQNVANVSLKTVNTAASLLWKYLTQEDLSKLETMNPFEVEKFFAELHKLDNFDIDLKQACFLDYYVTQYWWAAKQKKFNYEQTSTYFSLAYILMENLKEKTYTFSQNINQLQTIISDLNETLKPYNDDLLRDVLINLSTTFFQNYRLYEFVINETQNEIKIPKDMMIECPREDEFPYPPPLDEAMSEKIYRKYVLKIEDEVKQDEADKAENLELNKEIIDQIHSKFEGLSVEDAKQIIFDVTNELIADLKVDMKNKIKARETALINELSKAQKKK